MIRSLNTAASGMNAQQLNIDVIANNLANVNTPGFKKSRAEFQDLFYQQLRPTTETDEQAGQGSPAPLEVGQGVRAIATQKMFGQGTLVQTNNELDIAVEGDGFFQVQMPDGNLAYTRNGTFKLDATGQLVTSEGQILDPPVLIPEDARGIVVAPDGTVSVIPGNSEEQVEVGQIELTRFINPAGLQSIGHNLFAWTEGAGDPIPGQPGSDGFGQLGQGMLEGSNVMVVEEMIELIASQRAYEINSRVIQAADQMLRETTSMR